MFNTCPTSHLTSFMMGTEFTWDRALHFNMRSVAIRASANPIKADGLTAERYNGQKWLPWVPTSAGDTLELLGLRHLHQSVMAALNKQCLWGSLKTHINSSLFWIFDCIEKYRNSPTDLGHPKTSTTSKIHSSVLKLEFLHAIVSVLGAERSSSALTASFCQITITDLYNCCTSTQLEVWKNPTPPGKKLSFTHVGRRQHC